MRHKLAAITVAIAAAVLPLTLAAPAASSVVPQCPCGGPAYGLPDCTIQLNGARATGHWLGLTIVWLCEYYNGGWYVLGYH